MPGAKQSILVVDHDADERQMLVDAALEPSGYRVTAVGDGGEALRALETNPPDLIILDLHLQGLTGRDVLAGIRAQAPHVPVILLADDGAEKEALIAFRLGADDLVLRPVREAELIQAVERALRDAARVQAPISDCAALLAAGQAVVGIRRLTDVYDQVIRQAVLLTGAGAAGLYLLDDQSDALVLRGGYRLTPALEQRGGLPVEDALAAEVVASGKPLMRAGDALANPHPPQVDAKAVIYVPVVLGDSTLGALWVSSPKGTFTAQQRDSLNELARFAAESVATARLLAAMQARVRRVEADAEQPGTETADSSALAEQLRAQLAALRRNFEMFAAGDLGRLPGGVEAGLDVMRRQLNELADALETASPAPSQPDTPTPTA